MRAKVRAMRCGLRVLSHSSGGLSSLSGSSGLQFWLVACISDSGISRYVSVLHPVRGASKPVAGTSFTRCTEATAGVEMYSITLNMHFLLIHHHK